MSDLSVYESQEFVHLLELQGSTDLVTKSELLDHLRERGGGISPRTLTYYMTEGLAPKAVRVGERAGAYPRIVSTMVAWVTQARERGWSLDCIKELLPVWKYLFLTSNRQTLDLRILQELIARNVKSYEATHAVPSLLPMSLCVECLKECTLIRKDGSEVPLQDGDAQAIHFIHVEWDKEHQTYRDGGFTSVPLPTARPTNLIEDPNTMVMELPMSVESGTSHGHVEPDQQEDDQEEVPIA